MITLSNYKILEPLYESTNSIVYRGQREQDKLPVVIKILQTEYPTPQQLTHLNNEYEFTKDLNIQGIRKALGRVEIDRKPALLLEYVVGETLKQAFAGQRQSLVDFLKVALQIAQTLGEIHQHNIIHKDINAHNILFEPQNRQSKIIDFGLSSQICLKYYHLGHPHRLEGTLAYISPEQTGRMNRIVDYRTDLYSLGVTFYEMLTGQLPFTSDDPLELVHAHLAKTPLPPHQLRPDVPEIISQIIMKLLAKNAEERYQSAFGLKHDLEQCLEAVPNLSGLTFNLGQRDFSGHFQIPERLYGREQEVKTLLAAFERVAANHQEARETSSQIDSLDETPLPNSELMLVAGDAGVGKSVLVHEVHKPITEKRGYFVEGKFDQFQRNIPYYAWTQAFKSWVNLLLTENEASLANWRAKILKAVGDIGQVLLELIPNLELVMGSQPPVPELGGLEAQNRFNYLFQTFIRAIARPEHPLVIFIDDWQWADPASLHLLKLLVSDPTVSSLLLIGAYRSNEVGPTHPFMLAIDELRREHEGINTLEIRNLSLDHVQAVIADTLSSGDKTAVRQNGFQELSQLVYEKTLGNAFFVNEFLKSLYAEGLLQFDFSRLEWVYDVPKITALNITDNVVELLAGKVLKLPPATQNYLKLAACIGNEFETATLSVIAEEPEPQLSSNLIQALQEGLIFSDLSGPYKFTHDRIQQAAYSLIPAQDKQQVHLKIGRLLLQNTPPEHWEEHIFEIVNQLNLGLNLVEQQPDKTQLAELNLVAGKKAKMATAYQPAFNYFQTGLSLLAPQSWQTDYPLTLALHTEAAEMAYLNGDYETMEGLVATVLQQATDVLDKAKAYQIKIVATGAQNQGPEAIRVALEYLEQLWGWLLPSTPTPTDIQQGLRETMARLAGQTSETLLNLPLMTDPRSRAAMNILIGIGAIAYRSNPRLVPLLVFKMIDLSLTHGNIDASAYGYAGYGFLLSSLIQDIPNGYRFVQLALQLVDRLQARAYRSNVGAVAHALVTHWQDPPRQTLADLLEGHQAGLETGDLEYASANISYYIIHSYLIGVGLEELLQKAQPYVEVVRQAKHIAYLNRMLIYLQLASNLVEGVAQPGRLAGQTYDEEKMLAQLQVDKDMTALSHLYTSKMALNFLFEDYRQAQADGASAAQYLGGVSGQLLLTVFHFYDSLVGLANYEALPEADQAAILSKVSENQQKLEKWAKHAPLNNLHKYYLVEAERHRLLGQPKEAREYYDQALQAAARAQYLNEEALIAELAGKFYVARGDNFLAELYLRRAYQGYRRWGAVAKARQLEIRYPHLIRPALVLPNLARVSTTSSSGGTTTQFLDIHTILKASQTLAGEVDLSQLLTKMIKIVAENAGAEEGYLLLEQAKNWYIEAEYHVQDQSIKVLQSIPLETEGAAASPQIPGEIIHYVVATKEPVVLNYALQEGQFTHLPYIKQKQSKSVLCLPLLHQSKLAGVLYLENNLTPGAFSPQRLELLNLLISQMAISIENARLYTDLQQSEKKYRTIFEDSRDMIFITTPTGEIVDVSPVCFDLLGYTREEFIQMNAQDVYARAIDRARFRREVETHGAVKDLEIRLRRKDGVEIDCLFTATIWKAEDGAFLGYQGIIRDITAQKRAEQERLRLSAVEQELSLAKNIQQSLLPPPKPGWSEPEVVCYSMPAREVGGDLYAYYASPPTSSQPGKYIVTVGDVTGKGMPAALLMAVSLASLGSTVRQNLPPHQLLAQLDTALVDYTRETRQNCALLYVEITPLGPSNFSLRLSNAACPAPLVKRLDGSVSWVEIGGLPLGLGIGARTGYSEVALTLATGELLILISDGVIEARNASSEFFGFERLEAAVACGPLTSAEAMLEHLKTALSAFVADMEPHDDLTIVVVQV